MSCVRYCFLALLAVVCMEVSATTEDVGTDWIVDHIEVKTMDRKVKVAHPKRFESYDRMAQVPVCSYKYYDRDTQTFEAMTAEFAKLSAQKCTLVSVISGQGANLLTPQLVKNVFFKEGESVEVIDYKSRPFLGESAAWIKSYVQIEVFGAPVHVVTQTVYLPIKDSDLYMVLIGACHTAKGRDSAEEAFTSFSPVFEKYLRSFEWEKSR